MRALKGSAATCIALPFRQHLLPDEQHTALTDLLFAGTRQLGLVVLQQPGEGSNYAGWPG